MSTAATAAPNPVIDFPAQDERDVPLPLRGDTFLGVFEAIGEDTGINANWLRILFGALLLWNPVVIVSAYLGLGAMVALSRWLYPVRSRQAVPTQAAGPDEGPKDGSAAKRESEEELLAA